MKKNRKEEVPLKFDPPGFTFYCRGLIIKGKEEAIKEMKLALPGQDDTWYVTAFDKMVETVELVDNPPAPKEEPVKKKKNS